MGKRTTRANGKYHDLLYYVSRIKRYKRYVKLRWFNRQFPNHQVIVELYNPNIRSSGTEIQLQLIDLTQEELYIMGVPPILDDDDDDDEL